MLNLVSGGAGESASNRADDQAGDSAGDQAEDSAGDRAGDGEQGPPGGIGRPRLVRGREPLWRSSDCVQLGPDPRCAVAVDGLSPPLAELICRLDGTRTAQLLVADAVAAGATAAEARDLLAELATAGLVEDAELAGAPPDELAADAQAWCSRTGRGGGELTARRAAAAVEVHGDGRLAVTVAVLLAASGVGSVLTRPSGRVTRYDVGLGYLAGDVARSRAAAAEAAVARHRPAGPRRPRQAGQRSSGWAPDTSDVAVVADSAVHDAMLATRLVADGVPHLAVQVLDGRAVVGPFVLPGRTGCLRCIDRYRSERDPCWPRIAAQLARRPAAVSHAGAAIAAGIAVEQVLGLLCGPGEPATTLTRLDLDPLTGRLARRPWSAHPGCGCGAAPARNG